MLVVENVDDQLVRSMLQLLDRRVEELLAAYSAAQDFWGQFLSLTDVIYGQAPYEQCGQISVAIANILTKHGVIPTDGFV
jgi:hypothetical protein